MLFGFINDSFDKFVTLKGLFSNSGNLNFGTLLFLFED